jgi:bifunctional DNA-binding transcriptional regulator/antitoxin component of YhaV-PrlF toxin-antitoxin module
MNIVKIAPITTGGQISIPAVVRRRWGTRRVLIEDQGDQLVVKPIPDDPIAAVRGIFAGRGGHTTDELRKIARAEEREAEDRRRRNR